MLAGYDLNMVNLYISKVLQNVGCLVWEEVDDQERYSFIITGVQSALGERMILDQVGGGGGGSISMAINKEKNYTCLLFFPDRLPAETTFCISGNV